MLHYTVNQCLHWAWQQYGQSRRTWEWLGVKRCQLCLQDTYAMQSDISQQQWVSGIHCVWNVVECLIVYQDGDYLYPGQYSRTLCWLQIWWYCLWVRNILMTRPSTFLESRSWWGHDCGKFIIYHCTNKIMIFCLSFNQSQIKSELANLYCYNY